MFDLLDIAISKIPDSDYKTAIVLMGRNQVHQLQKEGHKQGRPVVVSYRGLPIVQIPEIDYGPEIGYRLYDVHNLLKIPAVDDQPSPG